MICARISRPMIQSGFDAIHRRREKPCSFGSNLRHESCSCTLHAILGLGFGSVLDGSGPSRDGVLERIERRCHGIAEQKRRKRQQRWRRIVRPPKIGIELRDRRLHHLHAAELLRANRPMRERRSRLRVAPNVSRGVPRSRR